MCGVSTQTVSRVINKRPDVSPAHPPGGRGRDRRGRVPAERRRSQPRPAPLADARRHRGRARATSASPRPSTASPRSPSASGYALLLKELANYGRQRASLPVIEFLIGHRVEGIIFAAAGRGREHPPRAGPAAGDGPPPIVFLKSEPSPEFSTIAIDNFGGAARWPPSTCSPSGGGGSPTSPGRSAGARRATATTAGGTALRGRRARARADRDRRLVVRQRRGSVRASCSASDPDLDARVRAPTTRWRSVLLHAAQRARDRHPRRQLAVVGFDGLDEARQFTPSLTTVRQPLAELGKLAVRELLEAIDAEAGAYTPRAIQLPVELIIGDSAPLAPSPVGRPARQARRSAAPSTQHATTPSPAEPLDRRRAAHRPARDLQPRVARPPERGRRDRRPTAPRRRCSRRPERERQRRRGQVLGVEPPAPAGEQRAIVSSDAGSNDETTRVDGASPAGRPQHGGRRLAVRRRP